MSSQHIDALTRAEYKAGFVTDIEQETLPPGLSEDVVRFLSAKKGEPAWLTDWRLKAYRNWLTLAEPRWAHVHYPPIDYQAISYYSAPRQKKDAPKSLDEVDPTMNSNYKSVPVKSSEITPYSLYLSRRDFLKAAGIVTGSALLAACAPDATPTIPADALDLPAKTDEFGDPANSYEQITNYNNFYEFTNGQGRCRITVAEVHSLTLDCGGIWPGQSAEDVWLRGSAP